MPLYSPTKRGQQVETPWPGVLEAAMTRRAAVDQLRQQRMVVLEINEKEPSLLDTIKKLTPF
jgi:hypothetical protein